MFFRKLFATNTFMTICQHDEEKNKTNNQSQDYDKFSQFIEYFFWAHPPPSL